jgi:hypothetical protein
MNGDEKWVLANLFACVSIVITVSVICGWHFGESSVRQQAVGAGVAHWVANQQTGTVEFEFIKAEK